MKKLFNITEEERNRILNLHDSAKNLTEQRASIDNTRVSRPIQNMDTSGQFRDYQGGDDGGAGVTGRWDSPTPQPPVTTPPVTTTPVPSTPPVVPPTVPPSTPPTQGGSNGQMQPAMVLADTVNRNKFIYQGMNGEVVKYLQTLLGIPNGDGKFGPQTKQALMDFQKKYHLNPDGCVGKKTGSLLMQFSNERGTKALNQNKSVFKTEFATPIQPQKTIPPTQPTQTQPTQTQPTQTQPTQPTWNSKYGNKNVNKFK